MNVFIMKIKEINGKFFIANNSNLKEIPANSKDEAIKYFPKGTPIEFIGNNDRFIREYKVFFTPQGWPYYKNMATDEYYNVHVDPEKRNDEAAIKEYVTEHEAAKGFDCEILFPTNE